MTDPTEKALNPLSLVAFFLGFGIFKYPSNQPRYCFSIFYILTVWSVYAYVLYHSTILFSFSGVFIGLLPICMVTSNWFVTIISIIITICKHKKYQQYIRKLDLVDDTLEKLGIPKEHHKMRNLTKQALITWFLMICVSWTFDSLLSTTIGDIRAILIPFVLSYASYVNSTVDITFILLLRHIGAKLDKINGHIEQLSEAENCGLIHKWKKSLVVNGRCVRNTKNRKHILWIVIHIHLELCQIARNINDFFGIQITLQMIAYFTILNSMFYFEYYLILNWKIIYKSSNVAVKILIAGNIWFIIYLMKLISLNHICESVGTKAQETKNIIHKLTHLTCFAEIREEIYQFVLQMSLRPLKFSGLGLFYFGYGFIRKFFVWILTTIIFMAQVKLPPRWIESRSRDNVTYFNIL